MLQIFIKDSLQIQHENNQSQKRAYFRTYRRIKLLSLFCKVWAAAELFIETYPDIVQTGTTKDDYIISRSNSRDIKRS